MNKKKIIIAVLFIIVTAILIIPEKNKNEVQEVSNKLDEKRAIFISYIELSSLKNKTIENQKKQITNIINNIKNYDFNMIILHVRPFSDAIYKSNIFPVS